MEFELIDVDLLREGAITALDNSKCFLADSLILFENQSYGHSISLLVLGIEEVGKALGYKYLYGRKMFGILKSRIDADPQNLLDDLQSNHFTKQNLAKQLGILEDLGCYNPDDLFKLKSRIDQGGNSVRYKSNSKKFTNLDLTGLGCCDYLEKILSSLPGNLDKLKQDGFYINISTINIHNPNTKDTTVYVRLIQLIDAIYDKIDPNRSGSLVKKDIDGLINGEKTKNSNYLGDKIKKSINFFDLA